MSIPHKAGEPAIPPMNPVYDPCCSWKRIQNLDARLVPSAEPPSAQERPEATRLVIVGDVHGQLAELKRLLQTIKFDRNHGDHLIFVGDLVNKGPDSPGVVQLAMDLGASSVRGNNEDRVLAARAAMKRGEGVDVNGKGGTDAAAAKTGNCNNTSGSAKNEDGIEPPFPRNFKRYSADSDFATAASLSEAQISWLSSLPLILCIPHLKGALAPPWDAGKVLIAHAGLVPSVPLKEQDEWAVMNMRGLVYPGTGPSEDAVYKAVVKGVGSRVRRYIASHDGSDDDIKAEAARLTAQVNDAHCFISISRGGAVGHPIESRDGDWWMEAWNRAQNSIQAPEQRAVVVYGHDAKIGAQIGPDIEFQRDTAEVASRERGTRYAFGLDSGCVYGNQLTAMVIERNSDGQGIAHSIVQVDYEKETKEEEKPKGITS
ncbi:hypothetical protein FZEAL_2570 [Fusarium zealandicum]|uniref:Calcineurin-like phosphoesterase domain-containing protein n=1 Tax=Fusarium zealandicum TaxID=1053134 RepID=A0A8H4UR22_9HYPO|nr:hypothetical protein FZEAL_2570 [Fusarium zealandicum]